MEKRNPPKAIFCWSGGKDSAYGLHKVLMENRYEIKYLLTTLNDNFRRISMHGVQEILLDQQAEAIGIPLLKVWVTEGTNEEYEKKMEAVLLKAKSEGIHHVLFGDIFLDDLKAYRERNLAKVDMKGIFPLWQMDTEKLLDDFINKKFKSIICCTNDMLGAAWLGREINRSFRKKLPEDIDPCGENGEYHSFCYDGPLFKNKINFTIGEKVYKELAIKTGNSSSIQSPAAGFWFCDLLPEKE